MVCKKCGHEVEVNDAYCPYCGGLLENIEEGSCNATKRKNCQKYCVSCGKVEKIKYSNCRRCGEKLVWMCTKCGYILKNDEKECPHCGAKLIKRGRAGKIVKIVIILALVASVGTCGVLGVTQFLKNRERVEKEISSKVSKVQEKEETSLTEVVSENEEDEQLSSDLAETSDKRIPSDRGETLPENEKSQLSEESENEGAVAIIENTKYFALQDALANTRNGEMISLLADIKEDVVIPEGLTVTVDMNGYTLTNIASHTIVNNGDLTIKGQGTIDNITTGCAAFVNSQGATATLEGGTFMRSKENGVENSSEEGLNTYYTIENFGSLVVNGATIKNAGSYSTALHNGWRKENASDIKEYANLTFSDGAVEGGIFSVKNDLYGVSQIYGGTFTGASQAAVYNKSETVITGGIFSQAPVAISNHGESDAWYMSGKCVVTGGTFETDKFSVVGNGAPDIVNP